MNSLFFNPQSRPGYYYDPEISDYVTGNPPDGSTEEVAPCADCCECPSVAVETKTRSASKTKCGFNFNIGVCNIIWLEIAQSIQTSPCGTTTCSSNYPFGPVSGVSAASVSWDPITCARTTTGTLSFTEPPTAYGCASGVTEYTTAALIANTVSALPAYGAFATSSPSASRNLSTDEISYAIADSVYRFRFKVPKVGSGTTYIIKWVERFSPEGGGAVTDTVKTFTWSGTIPSGYDATDSATWPLSDEYTLAVPSTDGATTLACITATCSGTAPTDPCKP